MNNAAEWNQEYYRQGERVGDLIFPVQPRTIYIKVGRLGDRPSVAAEFRGVPMHEALQVIGKWKEPDITRLAHQVVGWLVGKTLSPAKVVVDRTAMGEAFGEILGAAISRSALKDTVVCFADQMRVHSRDTRTQAVFRVLDLMMDPSR